MPADITRALEQIDRMEAEGHLTALGAYDMRARVRSGRPLFGGDYAKTNPAYVVRPDGSIPDVSVPLRQGDDGPRISPDAVADDPPTAT